MNDKTGYLALGITGLCLLFIMTVFGGSNHKELHDEYQQHNSGIEATNQHLHKIIRRQATVIEHLDPEFDRDICLDADEFDAWRSGIVVPERSPR